MDIPCWQPRNVKSRLMMAIPWDRMSHQGLSPRGYTTIDEDWPPSESTKNRPSINKSLESDLRSIKGVRPSLSLTSMSRTQSFQSLTAVSTFKLSMWYTVRQFPKRLVYKLYQSHRSISHMLECSDSRLYIMLSPYSRQWQALTFYLFDQVTLTLSSWVPPLLP